MNIYDLTLDRLKAQVIDLGLKPYKANQIYTWLYRGVTPAHMTDLSQADRQTVQEHFDFTLPRIAKRLVSSDNTVKYAFELRDGCMVESVLMQYKHGCCACISTQVGCAMGCKFCVSAQGGLIRNLTSGEMLGQILAIKKDIEGEIANNINKRSLNTIVLMGSGEPMLNFTNVLDFLENIKNGCKIGARHITLSTCGIPEKIVELANTQPQIGLSVSLHAPTDEIRKNIMPIAQRYSIAQLFDAIDEYIALTNRRVTLEYAIMQGVNGSAECAKRLAKLCTGRLVHVNLIPVNSGTQIYKPVNVAEIGKFRQVLEQKKVNVTVRRTLGSDIAAACGQLVAARETKGT